MICHDCQVAGHLNSEGNRLAMMESVAAAGDVREMAREWHRKCKDRNCPCQHVIGEVINRQFDGIRHPGEDVISLVDDEDPYPDGDEG